MPLSSTANDMQQYPEVYAILHRLQYLHINAYRKLAARWKAAGSKQIQAREEENTS